MMGLKIKILIAEHDAIDLELLNDELKNIGVSYITQVVQNESEYRNSIESFSPDIILADYTFPSFDGPTAFKIRDQLVPGTPFIFVSGTIGEEKSIELIKNGVTDYVLKDNLHTLNHKLLRAISESKANQRRVLIEHQLIYSERRLAMAQQMAHMGNWELNFASNEIKWSDEVSRIYGMAPGKNRHQLPVVLSFIHQADVEATLKVITKAQEFLQDFSVSYRIRRKTGIVRNIHVEGRVEYDPAGNGIGFYGIVHDVTENVLLESRTARDRIIMQKQVVHAILTALENERTFIGTELNENLSQTLATAMMYIQLSKNEDKKPEYLDTARGFILEAMTGIRKISKALVIPGTHIISLTDNIKNLIHDLSLIRPLAIDFEDVIFEINTLNEKLQLTIFRIVQEQLNNILLHSSASKATIRLSKVKNEVILNISDNGKGCDITKESGGVGIINIKSRAELYNGRVKIASSPGAGYELNVKLSIANQTKKSNTLSKNIA
ncbi:MAG: PAS domain-containing protein [Chitinophagaceae bacterium]